VDHGLLAETKFKASQVHESKAGCEKGGWRRSQGAQMGGRLSQDRLAVLSMTMSLVCLATLGQENANCAANARRIVVIVDGRPDGAVMYAPGTG
jgi:hypothetical protein